MGWTSLLEDIGKRFEDDNMSDSANHTESAEQQLREQIAIRRAWSDHVLRLVDIATDPTIDLAAKNKDLAERYNDACLLLQELHVTLVKAREGLIREKQARKNLERENSSMRAQIDSLTQNDMVYMRWVDNHSRPDDMGRYKPNA